MKRVFVWLAVASILVLAFAAPAFANEGGIKPRNYGDCVSAVATGIDTLLGGDTVQEFTENTAPLQSEGLGNADELGTRCRFFPPG